MRDGIVNVASRRDNKYTYTNFPPFHSENLFFVAKTGESGHPLSIKVAKRVIIIRVLYRYDALIFVYMADNNEMR